MLSRLQLRWHLSLLGISSTFSNMGLQRVWSSKEILNQFFIQVVNIIKNGLQPPFYGPVPCRRMEEEKFFIDSPFHTTNKPFDRGPKLVMALLPELVSR